MALTAVFGCGGQTSLWKSQQAGSIAVDSHGLIWVALADNGGVAVVEPEAKSGRQAFIPTGTRPERIILRGAWAYVSNRQSRTVSQIEIGSRKVTRTIDVGAEPIGLDTSADGATLVVANASGRSITAVDTATGSVKWTAPLNDEVRALIVLPDNRIYAPSFSNDQMHVLDLGSGAEKGSFSIAETTADAATARRATAVESIVLGEGDGRVFLPHSASLSSALDSSAPGFYATHEGAGSSTLTAVVPSITTVTYATDTVAHESDRKHTFPPPFLSGQEDRPIAGPKAAVITPSGKHLLIANQLSNNVTVISTTRDKTGKADADGISGVVGVGAGPTGIAIAPDDTAAFVHNAFDHSISVLRSDNGTVKLASTITDIAEQTLSESEQNGRRLFHDASDSRLSAQVAGGIACASCHPDGRTDGHTWQLTEGPRNTPALVGRDLEHARVYNRDGQITNHLGFSALIVDRMGGVGVKTTDLDDLFAWLASEPGPDNPHRLDDKTLTSDQRAGRLLFLTTAGCAQCHSGDTFTDRMAAEVGTGFTSIPLESQAAPRRWSPVTPPLMGIFASAPYLHDGSAAALQDVIRRNGGGLHGQTKDLTDAEVEQLAAFLLRL